MLTPDGWLPKGEATAQSIEGRRTVVWSGIPGEPIRVHVFHEGTHQDLARFVAPVGEPDPHRRAPPCPKYDACGGCPLMHLDAAGQRAARLSLIHDALAEHGLEASAPDTIVPSPDGDTSYRHVVKLAIGRSDEGNIRVGAFGRGSHRIVPIAMCEVATPVLRAAMSEVAHQIIARDLWPYDPKTGRGTIRHAVLRQSRATGEVLVTLVAVRRMASFDELAVELCRQVPAVVGVHLHLNDGPTDAIFLRDAQGVTATLPVLGKMSIEDEVAGERVTIGPGDFFQVNPAMADRIARDVLEAFDAHPGRPAVDLYCGVGGTTLALARRLGWAIGVEELDGAVERARANAQRAQVNAAFVAADANEGIDDVERRLDGRAPLVWVDPARVGIDETVLKAIVRWKPTAVASVSCNPRTFARDLRRFIDGGLQVRWIRAYDMFPQTAHVELVAYLENATPDHAPVRRPPRRTRVRGPEAAS